MSKSGDPANLAELNLLDGAKMAQGNQPQFVRIESGSTVYATQYSSERCGGRHVFEKVQVKSGSQMGAEGWICGSSTAHRKVGAL